MIRHLPKRHGNTASADHLHLEIYIIMLMSIKWSIKRSRPFTIFHTRTLHRSAIPEIKIYTKIGLLNRSSGTQSFFHLCSKTQLQHSFALSSTSMSAPLPNNHHHHIIQPPIYVSVRNNLLNLIVDILDEPIARALHRELHRLLHLRGDFDRNLQVTRLIGHLQRIIRQHPRTREFNFELLYPAPRFHRSTQRRATCTVSGPYGPHHQG